MKPNLFNFLFRRRDVAINSGKVRAIGVIANAAALSGGEWELIAPYGDFPTADKKKIQRFTKAEADQMVATFNSVFHKLGTLFRGVPIFHGHPDVDPKNWPDDRRLGKVTALEARADGLYGKPEYNALGEQNKTEGWWVYPSPAWLFPRTAANVIQPDELLSIGLVNTPNIPGSVPWSQNSGEPLPEDEPESPTSETDTIMKEKLCALLGLDPATATDDEVVAAVTTMKSDAAAKATAEENARLATDAKKTAETTAANSRKVGADAIAAVAIKAGKLTEADREATVNSLIAPGADMVALATAIGEKKPTLNTGALEIGGRKVAISNSRERAAAIQVEVNSRMQSRGLSYDDAYRSVETDPQFSQLFAAMKKPGEEGAE